jgi:hypothetical protein
MVTTGELTNSPRYLYNKCIAFRDTLMIPEKCNRDSVLKNSYISKVIRGRSMRIDLIFTFVF